VVGWPRSREELEELQRALAAMRPEPWEPPERCTVGAVFAAFSTRADRAGRERGWAAAVAGEGRAELTFTPEAPYEPGYLALREGRALEAVARALPSLPDVLLVDATGRDHPRGAGLALHLGAVLGVPTVGVTDRPLVAVVGEGGALLLDGREVGRLLRTRASARPVCVHAAWRTDVETACRVVAACTSGRARTPEPLRLARFLARSARARDEGRLPPGWRRLEPGAAVSRAGAGG
jgi:deoxyribonuclease V